MADEIGFEELGEEDGIFMECSPGTVVGLAFGLKVGDAVGTQGGIVVGTTDGGLARWMC